MSTSTSAEARRAPQARSVGMDVAYIAVFAALIWVSALIPPIPVGGVGVPITVQTLTIAISGMVLGAWRAFAATGLYLVLGLIGLPVFAGGSGGLGALAGPSAGYLVSFPFFAGLIGLLAQISVKKLTGVKLWLALVGAALVARYLIVWPIGAFGIHFNADVPLGAAFLADIPFWPGDLVKNILAGAIALMVHRAFPTVLVRR